MGDRPLEIVCVNAGDKFPDVYVQRLFNMLGRKFSRPFHLTCFTDRKRDVTSEVTQIDIGQWDARGPFNKIILYNADEMPYDEMFFMDITLVIKDDITHLVDHAKALDVDLVAIHDWKRPVMNSCFQWITKNDTTRAIWDVFNSDHYPEFRTKGDQFFTYSTIQKLGLEHRLGYFPDGQIQSFKVLRSANRESRAKFEELYKIARVIKFHGIPRAHEILNPWLRFWNVTVRYPHHAVKDWNFLAKEIRECWQ